MPTPKYTRHFLFAPTLLASKRHGTELPLGNRHLESRSSFHLATLRNEFLLVTSNYKFGKTISHKYSSKFVTLLQNCSTHHDYTTFGILVIHPCHPRESFLTFERHFKEGNLIPPYQTILYTRDLCNVLVF